MNELKIDQEFKTLIPPLTDEEYQQLTDNIVKEGCRDALIFWNGTIIDGHNRYEICNYHNIAFKTEEKFFDTRDEVKEWIIRNQFGRRNLSNYDRSRLALQLEEVIKIKAKEKQREAGGDRGNQFTGGKVALPPKSAELAKHIETREEIAKIAGVGHDTIQKVKIIEKEATPEQKQQLSQGKKTVNKVYSELRPKEEKSVAPSDKQKSEEVEVKKEESPAQTTEETNLNQMSVLSISRFSLIVNHFVAGINPLQFVHERFTELSKSEQKEFFWNINLAKEELASVEEHLKKFTEVGFND